MLRTVAFLLALSAIANAQDARVLVVDEDGNPVAGATVQALWWSDTDLGGPHATLVKLSAKTDEKGEAAVRLVGELSEQVCLLAFDKERAVFACHTPVAHVRKEGFALTLGPARQVRGRVTGATGARVRLLFPGSYEWHGIDATVAEDGAFAFAPLPEDVLARGAKLQARAQGMAPFEIELRANELRGEVPVPMQRARRVVGRVVDEKGEGVSGAKVWTGSWMAHGAIESGLDGAFALPEEAAGPFQLKILPPHHVLKSIDVPAGEGPYDLGAIQVAAGKPVKGTVKEFDGARIKRAFLALEDEDGVRVRSVEAGPGGAFELEAVGEGPHRLDCWVHDVEGIGGSRYLTRDGIVAGGPTVDLVVPEGLRVRFVDADGKPCAVGAVEVAIRSPRMEKPLVYECQPELQMRELRLLLRENLKFDLELRPRGCKEVVLSGLTTDAEGRLTTTATLVRNQGYEDHGWGPERAELPPAKFDETSDKEAVRKHVRAILDGAGERKSWSTMDPECDGLKAVGRAHVDVLVEALGSARHAARTWVIWAVEALADESSKGVILDALPQCRDLAGCVVLNGWQADAKDTLVAALRKEAHYLPPKWIEAVALLRDPATYDLLLRYLAKGLNSRHTWRAIRELPGLDARETVARAWPERRAGDRDFDKTDFALVAVEFGHVDALGVLIDTLGGPRKDTDVAEAVRRRTGLDGDADTLKAWFAKNRERLRFDEKDGVYRIPP